MNFKILTIATVILLVAIIGVAYLMVTPEWNKYALNKTQLATAQTQNSDAKKAKEDLDSFIKSFKEHQGDIAKVSSALPIKSPELPNLLFIIQDAAKANGVVLSSFVINDSDPQNEKASSDNSIQSTSISFSANSSFSAFKNLVLRLENSLRIMDLGHINLKVDDNGVLLFQISFQTYYQK